MGIEDLVAHPHVWRGRNDGCTDALPTQFDALDRFLPGGGWPLKAVTEILLDRYGIGELSLLMPALARLSRDKSARAKRWIAWIAPPFVPYAPALLRYGIDLDRVLMVHPTSSSKDVLWAVEQVLRSGSSIAVLAWVGDVSIPVLRRFQLAAEANDTWVVLFRPLQALQESSPAALRLRLSRHRDAARVEILKCRGRRPAVIDLVPSAGGRE